MVKIFYSNLSDYLDKWSKSLDGAETFAWMKLVTTPSFEKNVEPAASFILKHHPSADLDMEQLFDKFSLLEQCINVNLTRWASEGVSSKQRWLESLKSLKEQNRPIPNFSVLAQYAFAVPGSSAEVERLFSFIKDVWGPEKGHMEARTLEAFLDMKYNGKRTCQEFFQEVKNDKKLLAQVQSVEKYKDNHEFHSLLNDE